MPDNDGNQELDALVTGQIRLDAGGLIACDVQMRFSPRDPLVVRLAASHADPARSGFTCGLCVLSRDLLRAGLTGPAGTGKVHVIPVVLPGHLLHVAIQIHGQGQDLEVFLDHRILRLYLNRTDAIVPFGREIESVDMDRKIAQLLEEDT